jgi:hypothetical protein
LTSFTLLLSSAFFVSGDAPGFAGDPDGDATGDVDGEAIGDATTTGVGVDTGGFTSFALGSQAAPNATLAVRNVPNINDLLIVFTSKIFKVADPSRPLADILAVGITDNEFFHGLSQTGVNPPISINTAPRGTRSETKLADYFYGDQKKITYKENDRRRPSFRIR